VKTKGNESGLTLIEVLVSAIIVAGFFGTIFELSTVCLRYIDASKESVAALEAINDRTEALRNLAFSDLTSTAYVQNLMGSTANTSDFCRKATETVTIRAYPTASGQTQITRSAGGSVTVNSTAASLGTTLVQVDITNSWSMSLGGRARSEQTSTIISNGSKK
jgi:hypothetical protein